MSSANQFNLIDEPWVPIVGKERISLMQLFSNSSFSELSGNPIQKISLMKLLLAIAQAAFTPKDEEDWLSLSPTGMADKCLDYLEKWRDAFWLYGNQPFLQIPAIRRAKKINLSGVLPEKASGNTTLLLQSQIERDYSDAEKALLIISLMGFGFGGKKTDKTISLSEDYEKKPSGKPGTHLGSLGYLHNFLIGENLHTTIWLNLFTEEQVRASNFPQGVGIPPWEKMPTGESCATTENLKKSLIGRLIPLSRFCLLADQCLHYSDGINHLDHKEGAIDPSIATDQSKKEIRACWVDIEKRPWRLLTSLLSFISQTKSHSLDCLQIRHGLTRARQNCRIFGIWSGGLKVSSKAGEQFLSGMDDFVESKVVLQSDWLGEDWFQNLKTEMEKLENLSKGLKKSVSNYFNSEKAVKNQKTLGDKMAGIAINKFWQMCEKNFRALTESCADKDPASRERMFLQFNRIALTIYDEICAKATARQIDSWAKHRPYIKKHLNKKSKG